ncbi:MAG: carboxypeptidase-like regulatory domain-containing protein [Planctomycetes bacterium]|nr:carboxypeptidase-like regulatory domain-containing protein [Planctomycetota bacterium]
MAIGGSRRARSLLVGGAVVIALVGILASVLIDRGSNTWESDTSTVSRAEFGRETRPVPSPPGSDTAPSPEREGVRAEAPSVPTPVEEPARRAVIRGRLATTDGSPPPTDALVSIVTDDPTIDFPEVAARLGGKRAYEDAYGGPERARWRIATIGLPRALRARAAEDGTFAIPVPWDLARFGVEVESESAYARTWSHPIDSPEVDPVLTVFVNPAGRLEGTVRATDGRPVAGALVVCEPHGEPSVRPVACRSGADGAFVLRGLAPGRHEAAAFGEGFAPAIAKDLAVSARQAARCELRLAGPSSVSGRVLDQTGKGVGGARVQAFPSIEFRRRSGFGSAPYGQAVAGADGSFRIGSLGAGEHQVSAEAPGFGPAGNRKVQVPAGGAIEGVELVLDAGKVLAGKVLDRDGAPVEDASVRADLDTSGLGRKSGERKTLATRVTARTSADGSFRLGGLGDGPFIVRASHPEHGARRLEPVEPGREDLGLRLPGRTGVAGIVREAESGEPVRRFTVEFGEPDERFSLPFHLRGNMPARRFDSADGSFEIVELKSSEVGLRVTAPGFVQESLPKIEVKPGEVRRDVDVRLRRGGSIRGRVVEQGSGEPVAGVEVHWNAEREDAAPELPRGRGTSGPDGSFLLQGLRPGKANLSASHSDFVPGPGVLVEVRAEEVTEGISLAIDRGGAIEGLAVGPDGFSYAGSMANVSPLGEAGWKDAVVGEDGRFRVGGLRPGKYLVRVPHPPSAARKSEDYAERMLRGFATVEEGKVSPVEFPEPVKGICTVKGRVLRGEAPVANAGVSLTPGGAEASAETRALHEGRWFSRTGEDGAFEFRGVPPGEATLHASAPPRWSEFTIPARVPDAPEIVVDLQVPSGRIEGRVLRASDLAPIPEVSVRASSGDPDPFRDQAWAQTDREGRYAIGDLSPGTYAVTADVHPGKDRERAGLAPQRREAVRVAEGEPTVADFLLEIGGTARVLVLGPEGEPLDDISVALHERGSEDWPSFSTMHGKTDREGKALLEGIPPGTYFLTARVPTHAVPWSGARTVRAGEEVEFRLDLKRGTTVRLACVGTDGGRVEEPRIRIADPEGREVAPSLQEGRSDTKYAATWWGVLVPGTYSLEGRGKGYRTRTVPLRVDTAGPKEFLVPLEKEESPK